MAKFVHMEHDRVQCPSEFCNFSRLQILVGPHSEIYICIYIYVLQGLGPQSGPIIWIGQAGTVDSVDETCMKRCSQNLSRILQISWRDLLKLSQSWVLFNIVAKLEILGVSAFPWNVASNPNTTPRR